MDQVSESELEIIPSFILCDQTYRIRGILDPSSMNPSQQLSQVFFVVSSLDSDNFLTSASSLPNPPLPDHFALSEMLMLTLGQGRGGWVLRLLTILVFCIALY